jgi:hypothetical protein
MKRLGQQNHVKHLATRLDGIHALSRSEVSRRTESGEQWKGLKDNVGLLGISANEGRAKMVFAATGR